MMLTAGSTWRGNPPGGSAWSGGLFGSAASGGPSDIENANTITDFNMKNIENRQQLFEER
jgi:hypothetical protein